MRRSALLLCAIGAAFMPAGCQIILGIDTSVPIADSDASTSSADGSDWSVDGSDGGTEGSPCDPRSLSNDPANCGACGHSCCGGLCSAGKCQPVVLAAANGHANDIDVDEQYVYWTSTPNQGVLNRVDKRAVRAAGIPFLQVAGSLDGVTHDGSRIYVGSSTDNRIYVRDKSGAQQRQIDGLGPVWNVAVDTTGVYWAIGDGTTGSIVRGELDGGGAPTKLTTEGGGAGLLKLDNGFVYWRVDMGFLYRRPKDATGSDVKLEQCGSNITDMVIDDSKIYWLSESGANLRQADKGDALTTNGCYSASAVILASDLQHGDGLAIDGANVYVSDGTSGEIRAYPKTGGPGQTLATGQNKPARMAVDGQCLYWIDGDGAIAKVALP